MGNATPTAPGLSRRPDLMDSFIEEVVAIADSVGARRRSAKRIMLSFNEWNVWYRTRRNRAERGKAGWPVAPDILEEVYTMQDALTFDCACISLLNHADRVRAACLAQLVNVIAPIMTETGSPAWRQTIFWPFSQWSNSGRGWARYSNIFREIVKLWSLECTGAHSTRAFRVTHPSGSCAHG
jgi:alpha-N-arabinofuranosidase